MSCPQCTGPSQGNNLCQSCKQEDYDLSSQCAAPGCDREVVLVEVCDHCSDTAKAARSDGAGTVITGPDATDRHIVGGDEDDG